MHVSPLAGTRATPAMLIDVAELVAAYYDKKPDPSVAEQRVAFGTSGHRGSAREESFNEAHVLAITQSICLYRKQHRIDGPLYLGIDTHALSVPAFETALEVLAANDVDVLIARDGEYTPTPAISHAILVHNCGRRSRRADGIIVTPSHNPPDSGGFKYNPPHGGPAETEVTAWIEEKANALLEDGLKKVRRVRFEKARHAESTREHDFLNAYVSDLRNVIDLDAIHNAGIRIGVDPLGGAGVNYWPRIADRYQLDLSIVSGEVDSTFGFMSLDWDGRIRMDPSSEHAMQRLIGLRRRYDIAFGCDTDHDRHGIVTSSAGLLPANHYLSVAIAYLFSNRPRWSSDAAVGKTVVSSAMIDKVAAKLNRSLVETPVGFKWFVDGLLDGSLAFAGEESAGASLARIDGSTWTTDKDGIAAGLLAAEITARIGRDPAELYRDITCELGNPAFDRVEAPATAQARRKLAKLSARELHLTELAGEPIERIIDRAPGNHVSIGGIKVITASGWFAARPSGTEDIYKIYAESFRGEDHLRRILEQAQTTVDRALADR